MCFTKQPPIYHGDLILKLEEMMETLDDFNDLHLETHYISLSNWLMRTHKKINVLIASGRISSIESPEKMYELLNTLQKEFRLGLIPAYIKKVEQRLEDGNLRLLSLNVLEQIPDDLSVETHLTDKNFNIYFRSDWELYSSCHHRSFDSGLTPIGFIHPLIDEYIPVPERFREEMGWKCDINNVIFVDDLEEARAIPPCTMPSFHHTDRGTIVYSMPMTRREIYGVPLSPGLGWSGNFNYNI